MLQSQGCWRGGRESKRPSHFSFGGWEEQNSRFWSEIICFPNMDKMQVRYIVSYEQATFDQKRQPFNMIVRNIDPYIPEKVPRESSISRLDLLAYGSWCPIVLAALLSPTIVPASLCKVITLEFHQHKHSWAEVL